MHLRGNLNYSLILHRYKLVLKALPKTTCKNKDQESSLPNQFELPKNFRLDVAAALETGQMTRETTTAFTYTVASCIFRFKKYPTKEELIDVARCIVEKYPFMKEKKKPYVSIIILTKHVQGSLVTDLQCRMKERRRPKKDRPKKDCPTI